MQINCWLLSRRHNDLCSHWMQLQWKYRALLREMIKTWLSDNGQWQLAPQNKQITWQQQADAYPLVCSSVHLFVCLFYILVHLNWNCLLATITNSSSLISANDHLSVIAFERTKQILIDHFCGGSKPQIVVCRFKSATTNNHHLLLIFTSLYKHNNWAQWFYLSCPFNETKFGLILIKKWYVFYGILQITCCCIAIAAGSRIQLPRAAAATAAKATAANGAREMAIETHPGGYRLLLLQNCLLSLFVVIIAAYDESCIIIDSEQQFASCHLFIKRQQQQQHLLQFSGW